jgi:para-nitrobenzyl esterase
MSIEYVTAAAPSGLVTGRQDATVLRFAGIRYGMADRFARPRPVPAGGEAVDATVPGPICPQGPSRLAPALGQQTDEPQQSEDCLFLSVTTPSLQGSRPVMVWLHGGAFLTGGGTLPWYDGGRLTADGDVVVVSVNYRLGLFGFLVHDGTSEGNLGLLDQALALEWVHDNIAAFGGDPERITLFGQSAGAISTHLLLAQPASRALVQRAIIQSSPTEDIIFSVEDAAAVGRHFVEVLGGAPRSATVPQLLAAQAETARWNAARNPGSVGPPFGPVLADPVAPVEERRAVLREEPLPELMVGYTTEECVAFAYATPDPDRRRAFVEMSGPIMVEPTRAIARDHVAAGGTAFEYAFAWTPRHGGDGAVHCLELPFLLGTERSWANSPMLGDTSWAEVEELGRVLRKAWTTFAHHGRPDEPGHPDSWPPLPHVRRIDAESLSTAAR